MIPSIIFRRNHPAKGSKPMMQFWLGTLAEKEMRYQVLMYMYSTDRTQPNRKRTQSGPSAFALGSLGRTQSERRANPELTQSKRL
jgi:hypothetical protein